MHRRTFLQGLAAAAVGAPAITLLGQQDAQAAVAANYYVATTEQTKNKVLVFPKNKAFSDANVHWSFSPGGGAWSNLSDVKIRETAAQGWIALVAASGGKAGIVDIDSEKNTELNDVAWSATPGGNPHAIERVPGNGSVIVASSDGKLTLYAPSSVGSLGSLAKVQTVDYPGAHGVLWDPTYELLWVVGKNRFSHYAVMGSKRNTRLKYAAHFSLGSGNLGHDLQPDYTNHQKMLITSTKGVYELLTDGGSFRTRKISSESRVKSYVKHSSGEVVSIRGDGTQPRDWANKTVRLSASPDRTRSGAQFYKARIWTTAFQ
ncbi:DUF6528 family protein [Kribbella sp. NBC_01484]|uniref:DUF6528 family protein n=1 Tax=Kribbella sp. NBC_01484 TaxID=2903579 RepID=UPI002E30BCE6|nr:DUF6528 family protein [Kribbella sp. NBC_01484]